MDLDSRIKVAATFSREMSFYVKFTLISQSDVHCRKLGRFLVVDFFLPRSPSFTKLIGSRSGVLLLVALDPLEVHPFATSVRTLSCLQQ